MVGVSNHPNWITFLRNTLSNHNSSRVISYINVRLSQFYFSLWKDIFNHRDISYISFFNCDSIYFLINIYLDSFQTALRYLKDTKANINNILVITGNFNTLETIVWILLFFITLFIVIFLLTLQILWIYIYPILVTKSLLCYKL